MDDKLSNDLICKVCEEEFETQRALHSHIKKHKLSIKEYYESFYNRRNLYNGRPIEFKNVEQYFSQNFDNIGQMKRWMNASPKEVVQELLLWYLSSRVEKKGFKYAPSHIDLKTSKFPCIDDYARLFGSYKEACDSIGIKQIVKKNLPSCFWGDLPSDMTMFIDTREQKPLSFNGITSLPNKLDVGDYTLAKENYNYCFVERKSEGDFLGTFGFGGIGRFKQELNRAREFNSYVFIVCEASLDQIIKNNGPEAKNKRVKNLEGIFHNMRDVSREFADVCQILFVDGRDKSAEIIPRILFHGPSLKDVDVQYFLEKDFC